MCKCRDPEMVGGYRMGSWTSIGAGQTHARFGGRSAEESPDPVPLSQKKEQHSWGWEEAEGGVGRMEVLDAPGAS
jgi:hypothetical protein